jgi:hypothetical protein
VHHPRAAPLRHPEGDGVIPAELRELDRWVVWRWETDPEKPDKPRKPPYCPTDLSRHASSTKPETWATFDQAIAVVEAGKADGIGLALEPPWVLVDLDDELSEFDKAAIIVALDSYTERSPSGTGHHVILRASLNGHGRHPEGIGVFQTARFAYFTGEHEYGTPETVEERQEQLEKVLAHFVPASKTDCISAVRSASVQPVDLDDQELIERAMRAHNGVEFSSLWMGFWQGSYSSQSEADLAFCSMLAFWTGLDPDRIDRLFRSSGLMREKWNRDDYRERTIATALEGRTEFYSSRAKEPAPEPQSVPEPEDGAVVLDDVAAGFRRYVVASPEAVDAVALWIAHTWCFEAFELSPLLPFSSPVERSGKTTAMKVLRELVRRPWSVITPSEAVVFRKIARDQPTVLLDEYDAIFSQKEQEPLRALLNAGNEPDTKVPRCVGPKQELQDFDIYCPKALAGIGKLPRTVDDRSIKIKLKRKASGETAMKFRRREAREFLSPIRDRLAAWAEANQEQIGGTYPELPDGLNDRAEDCWEPLIAIADIAGGEWPQRARAAAKAVSSDSDDEDEHALGVILLGAIRQVFERLDTNRIFTASLIGQLAKDDESPFAEWWDEQNGKPEKGVGRELSKLLRPFEVRSKKVRIGEKTLQGYELESFEDAFARYPAPESGTSGTTAQPSQKQAESIRNTEASVPDSKVGSNPHGYADVPDVPDFGPPDGEIPF